ncbi:copper chaperone PCu(A)C [Peterkaempfera bronchialis]|uniref:DUF461 domain-containing protein n=1 Tax=Peterkaempfera bronchialis TaxID=2126346 RepID=A0A345SX10_9ACTN|nr:DUF461 domain-containing protein [Peterkaempfera bronchialis]AXI78265.1 DUF461 domain-containing protein [Peterkaempfera bronchialis]
MSRSLRRGAIAALVLAIVPLSACAAGTDAASLQVKPDHAATSLGNNLQLNNILLVTEPGDGSTESETRPAAVSVNISNTGPTAQILRSVTVGGAATAEFTGADGSRVGEISVPAGGSVLLGGPGQPTVHVADAKVQQGGYSPVTFDFDTAGTVSAEAAVVSGTGEYASFAPTASASPTAPAASASPSGS